MCLIQIPAWVGFVVSLVLTIKQGHDIAKEVNSALGTSYKSPLCFVGKEVWKEHERLFPASRQREHLYVALICTFVFLITAPMIGC
jgi:hypothetical protein